jgi:hypothetical protein
MTTDQKTQHAPPDLYVGYRPVPQSTRRTLVVLIPGLAATLLFIAAGLAVSQRSPGTGTWTTTPTQRTGTIYADPIPLLIEDSPTPRITLLVEEGKHGAQSRATSLAGQRVTLTGTSLSRGEIEALEIISTNTNTPQPAPRLQPIFDTTTLTLAGEIVDAKCYLGAMKPGDGRTHKACATLCVGNGIPALFVSGDIAYIILPQPLPTTTSDFIGEPVEMTGIPGTLAGMPVVRITSVHRKGVLASTAASFTASTSTR